MTERLGTSSVSQIIPLCLLNLSLFLFPFILNAPTGHGGGEAYAPLQTRCCVIPVMQAAISHNNIKLSSNTRHIT